MIFNLLSSNDFDEFARKYGYKNASEALGEKSGELAFVYLIGKGFSTVSNSTTGGGFKFGDNPKLGITSPGGFGGGIPNKGASGAKKTVDINNPVLENVRTGSALKSDAQHAFNDIIDNYAGDATKFPLKGGDGVNRSLYQLEGSLNGKKGIFEWIIDPDPAKGVTHRRFIENVGITGKPNARP